MEESRTFSRTKRSLIKSIWRIESSIALLNKLFKNKKREELTSRNITKNATMPLCKPRKPRTCWRKRKPNANQSSKTRWPSRKSFPFSPKRTWRSSLWTTNCLTATSTSLKSQPSRKKELLCFKTNWSTWQPLWTSRLKTKLIEPMRSTLRARSSRWRYPGKRMRLQSRLVSIRSLMTRMTRSRRLAMRERLRSSIDSSITLISRGLSSNLNWKVLTSAGLANSNFLLLIWTHSQRRLKKICNKSMISSHQWLLSARSKLVSFNKDRISS